MRRRRSVANRLSEGIGAAIASRLGIGPDKPRPYGAYLRGRQPALTGLRARLDKAPVVPPVWTAEQLGAALLVPESAKPMAAEFAFVLRQGPHLPTVMTHV